MTVHLTEILSFGSALGRLRAASEGGLDVVQKGAGADWASGTFGSAQRIGQFDIFARAQQGSEIGRTLQDGGGSSDAVAACGIEQGMHARPGITVTGA